MLEQTTLQETTLRRLTLTDFRSYPALRFTPHARLSVFTGPNGSGKTNLLEAVSLLVPGRGLRGARFSALARRGPEASGGWAVAAQFDVGTERFEIGTGSAEANPERRVFRLDGAAPRLHAEIAARLATVWLTPQMEQLFTESGSGRRRFLDRLVVALEPGHAREVAAFETAAAQRNRLLQQALPDPDWLVGLEDAMARHAVAIAAARRFLLSRMNRALSAGVADPFPVVRLGLVCEIDARLQQSPALCVEDWLREGFAKARMLDAERGFCTLGPRRADLEMTDEGSGQPAGLASTGQQKSMLIGIILAHAALIASARGSAPLLLLDEPLVHLDAARREALFAALASLGVQALLTGTDAEPFKPLSADYYVVRDSRIEPL